MTSIFEYFFYINELEIDVMDDSLKSPSEEPAGAIRKSTNEDIDEILRWLKKQDRDDTEGTFLCNWNLTLESHKEGNLIVFADSTSDKPIAYQWGGLITPGILEVRTDKRGRGIGKRLVEYRIEEARRKNNALLRIQCTPETSIPFWERMGFQIYDHSRNYAFRILDVKHLLPVNGTVISVKIDFYPARRDWEPQTPPAEIYTPDAVKGADGDVYLSERVSFFDTSTSFDRDPVVAIHIDGEQIYLGKAKYKQAAELGVCGEDRFFYIDKINLQKSS